MHYQSLEKQEINPQLVNIGSKNIYSKYTVLGTKLKITGHSRNFHIHVLHIPVTHDGGYERGVTVDGSDGGGGRGTARHYATGTILSRSILVNDNRYTEQE